MNTVRDVMDRYGVTQATVLGWIASGELKAVNVARKPGAKKPRWRISADALATFEAARSAAPAAPRARARRRTAGQVVEFY